MAATAGPRHRYFFGTAVFDEARFELLVDGQQVKVEPKPLEVLLQLLVRMGEVVPREELRLRLWPRIDPADHVIANAIRKLRAALGRNEHFVVTVPRQGFRLSAAPRRVAVSSKQPERGVAQLRASIQRAFSELREIDSAIEQGRLAVQATTLSSGALSAEALASRLLLASDLARAGAFAESQALLDQVCAELAAEIGSRHLDWANWWWVQSDLQAFQLDLPAALASAEKASEHLSLGRDPDIRLADGVRTRLGKALRMLGDFKGSERVFLELANQQSARDGAGAQSTQLSRLELARSFMFQQRTDAALKVAQGACEYLESSLGRYNLATLSAHDAIATIQFKMQAFAEAARTWQQVADDQKSLSSRPNDFSVTTQSNVALAWLYAGQPSAAETAGRLALSLAQAILPQDAPRTQSIRYQLALCLVELGRPQEVAALLEGLEPAALNMAVQAGDWAARILYLQGRLAFIKGEADLAFRLLSEALEPLAHNSEASLFAPARVRHWLALAKKAR